MTTLVDPSTVLAAVAKFYHRSEAEIIGPARHRSLVEARHVAMYLLEKLCEMGATEIGHRFERDHSNTIYGIRKIKAQIGNGGDIDQRVKLLTSDLVK